MGTIKTIIVEAKQCTRAPEKIAARRAVSKSHQVYGASVPAMRSGRYPWYGTFVGFPAERSW